MFAGQLAYELGELPSEFAHLATAPADQLTCGWDSTHSMSLVLIPAGIVDNFPGKW